MADFTPKSIIRSAVRKFAVPFEDVDSFNAIVQSVITNNPFGCAARIVSGVNHPPIEKAKESYTARFIYQDAEAKRVGSGSDTYASIAGYKAGVAAVLANAANNTAHGGVAIHDSETDTFSATLKCYAANGEIFMVMFNRTQVTISSYEDDAILGVVETWADGVPALD